MANPTGNTTVQFRAAPNVLAPIRERARGGEPDGAVARRDLERYYAVLAEELRRVQLTAEEAALICDAFNGFVADPIGLVLRAWWIDVEDHIAMNDAAAKWGVKNPAVLVAKLRALSPGASMAILDAVQRWWNRALQAEGIAESLREVGLIRKVPEVVAWETETPEDAEGEEWKA